MRSRNPIILSVAALMGALCVGGLCAKAMQQADAAKGASKSASSDTKKLPFGRVEKSEAEWKKILSPNTFEITRKAETEPAFHNEYFNNHQPGIYKCADCGLELFSSKTKFESGTGWPSFWQPIENIRVTKHTDHELGYERTEVRCARCDAHLGHVFDDGPKPTGLRYCMNSGALKFVKETKETKNTKTPAKQ